MKKINGGYLSFFEFLVDRNFPFAVALDKKFYPVEHGNLESTTIPYDRRYNETPKLLDQFIGALQPLASIANDFQYTFAPYKSRWEFLMDLAQPLRGFGHILRGLASLVGAPLYFLSRTVVDFFSVTYGVFLDNMIVNGLGFSSWLIDGLSSLVRGFTQIAATPLTWILRIPLRGILSGIKGTPDISENEDIQRLVSLGEEANTKGDTSTVSCIIHRLHEEYQKALAQGQGSRITLEAERESFDYLRESAPASYLQIFKKPEATRTEPGTPSVIDSPKADSRLSHS